MATRERLIVEAILQALREAQIAGVEDRVSEDRGFAIAAVDLPAIDITTGADRLQVLDAGDYQLGHELVVEIGVLAREEIGVSPSKRADPIVAAAHRAVMQSTELDGLVRAITPEGVRSDRQPSGDGVVLRRTLTYIVDHVTAVDDLEAAP